MRKIMRAHNRIIQRSLLSGPSSFSDPIRRRVASSLARRLARHLLVRPADNR